MQRLSSALFLLGLGVLIAAILRTMELGSVSPLAGEAINAAAADQVGAANFVTAVVLGYRGFDTLGGMGTRRFQRVRDAGGQEGPGRAPPSRSGRPMTAGSESEAVR